MRVPNTRPTVFLGFVLTWLVLSTAAARPQPPQTEAAFYFDRQVRIPLVPADFVAIRWRSREPQDLLTDFPQLSVAGKRELPRERLTLYPLVFPSGTVASSHLLEDLGQRTEIEQVMPVYRAPEALMIATEQLLAGFARNMPHAAIARLAADLDLELGDKVSWAPATYLLRTRSGDALDAAGRLRLRPEVLWAHPDFVRIIERPQVSSRPAPDLALLPAATGISPAARGAKGMSLPAISEPTTFRSRASLEASTPIAVATVVDRLRLAQEDFEGSFPGDWQLSGNPTWYATTYRPYSGLWSGYAVGSAVAPPGPYPNNVDAWMVYGPFSLEGAQAARVDMQAWIQTESYYDYFKVAVSIDGSQWYGLRFSGDFNGWRNIALDLAQVPTLGSLLDQPQVWLALVFESDVSVTLEGVYVDEIVLETIDGGYQDLTSDEFDHLQWSLANNEQSWGTEGVDIRAVEAWEITPGSDAVTIAVIDEGVDLSHPELAAKLVSGYDATGGGSEGGATGDEAHGTACAALAAAVTDNGLGVAGVSPLTRLMPVRIFVNGYTRDSWAADGIAWAVTQGADILSNSWGGGLASTAINEAIDFAASQGRGGLGSVVLFAAGNSNSGVVSYPASLSGALAVGALSPCDERKSHTSCDGEFWWGSNYGSDLDLLAPGVQMYSADLRGEAGYRPGDYLADFNGTSSATPVVAGVAALVLGLSPDSTAGEVRTLLVESAHDLATPGWDAETGHGRLSALGAVMAVLTAATDLAAVEVSFRDLPAGGGELVSSPTIGQEVWAHLRFFVETQSPLTGRIAALSLDGDLLCDHFDTVASGEHLVWCALPWRATAGTHQLLGHVDPDGLIPEFDESNNAVTIDFDADPIEPHIFSDGFESGDLSRWEVSAP